MKFSTLASGAMLLASSSALPQRPYHRGPPPWDHGGKKAVYFLRVDPAGSNVVAVGLDRNGRLTDSTSVTSTNGNGLPAQNASTPDLAPVSIDPLQGQTAVSVGDNVSPLRKKLQQDADSFVASISSPSTLAATQLSCSRLTPLTR